MTSVMFQCFALHSMLTNNTYSVTFMTEHFCVLVLFDYPCDMHHESESNTQIKLKKIGLL